MEIVKDRYELLELIGRGANAVVFKALDRESGRIVAVKKMVADQHNMNDWRCEIHMLRSLHHPCIIRYLDDGVSETSLYIVMEYAERGSLLANIKRGTRMTSREVATVLGQILSGLAYLHQRGVVHRDIKAANVLIGSDGIAKLCDFGLAIPRSRRFREEDEEKKMFVGSVYWMSPETIAGEPQNEVSDIWSLGCLCIELLTGVPPFFDRDPINALYHIAKCDTVPLPVTEDPEVRDFLSKCLVRDPNARLSAKSLLELPWIESNMTSLPQHPQGNSSTLSDVSDAVLSPLQRGDASAKAPDSSLAAVIEQHLITETTSQQEQWLTSGGLRRVIGQLTSVTAEEAFHVVRVLAYAARRFVGTPAAESFLNNLADAHFWSMDLAVVGTMDSVAQLFVCSCEAQDPTQSAAYPPAHEATLRLLLMHEPCAGLCANALHKLVVLGPNGDGSEASGAAQVRWEAACDRIFHRASSVLRQMIEEQCITAFRDKQEPLLKWEGTEKLIQVVEAVARVSHSPRIRILFEHATENWFIALEEAARHNCPAAVRLLAEFVESHGNDEGFAGEFGLLLSTFIHIVSDSRVDSALRLRVLRTLPAMQRSSPLAAAQLCDVNTSVPLLAHTLFALPADEATRKDEALAVMAELCKSGEMAAACSAYNRFLVNAILKVKHSFEQRHPHNLTAALTLIDSLFTYTSRPELLVTSNDLTKNLALICQSDDQVCPPEVRELAVMVFDALAAQSKFI